MITEQIFKFINNNQNQNILDIPVDIFENLTIEQAEFIQRKFSNNTMFKLPQSEIQFFDWLKLNDMLVWQDLWNDELYDPYVVSIGLLHRFAKDNYKGYPICELQSNDNYYFVAAHLVDKESRILVESAKSLYTNSQPMTIPQWLALTISVSDIDIWHFAYKNQLELNDCKEAVQVLVEDNILVHLKEAEHLSTFLEI